MFSYGQEPSHWIQILCTSLFLALLAAVAAEDGRCRRIPDRLTGGMAVCGAASFFIFPEVLLWERLAGMAVVSLPMFFLALWASGGFGGGDVKLAAAAGLFLGWEKNLLAFCIAVYLAAGYGGILVLKGKKGRKDKVPFGPFFAAGCLVSCLFGGHIIRRIVS